MHAWDIMIKEEAIMKLSHFILLTAAGALMAGCGQSGETASSKSAAPKVNHVVTEEQYNQFSYRTFVAQMATLNFTAEWTENNGEKTYTYRTKYDNGKVCMETSYGVGYLQFHEGTYSETDRTWTYDVYYEEEGAMVKQTYENDSLPDDMVFPTIADWVAFNEMKYNGSTRRYELIAETKTVGNYVYSNIRAKFENGRILYQSYDYYATYSPDVHWSSKTAVSDYGATSVELPVVE